MLSGQDMHKNGAERNDGGNGNIDLAALYAATLVLVLIGAAIAHFYVQPAGSLSIEATPQESANGSRP
jgi:hypothetical protein